MECCPVLKFGLLNGWIMLCSFYAVFGLMLLVFPREVVKRLYDQTGWSQSQRMMATLAKGSALIYFVLLFLTPLRIGANVFIVGGLMYLLGVALMVVALINFRNTPLGQPVAGGLYKLSRNPQWLALVLLMMGIAIAIGSWLAVILNLAIMVFGHFRILAEEQTCLEQYQESYRAYMERVPRYLWVL